MWIQIVWPSFFFCVCMIASNPARFSRPHRTEALEPDYPASYLFNRSLETSSCLKKSHCRLNAIPTLPLRAKQTRVAFCFGVPLPKLNRSIWQTTNSDHLQPTSLKIFVIPFPSFGLRPHYCRIVIVWGDGRTKCHTGLVCLWVSSCWKFCWTCDKSSRKKTLFGNPECVCFTPKIKHVLGFFSQPKCNAKTFWQFYLRMYMC